MTVHTHRSYHDGKIADTLWKRSRLARREKRKGEPLGISLAHPTKRATKGRKRMGRPISPKAANVAARSRAMWQALLGRIGL